VKPLFYLPRAILIFCAVALAAMLSACGQTGPLYLPKPPPDPDAPAAPVTAPQSKTSTPAHAGGGRPNSSADTSSSAVK
jgi:predicted small lipoprotein YifL